MTARGLKARPSTLRSTGLATTPVSDASSGMPDLVDPKLAMVLPAGTPSPRAGREEEKRQAGKGDRQE